MPSLPLIWWTLKTKPQTKNSKVCKTKQKKNLIKSNTYILAQILGGLTWSEVFMALTVHVEQKEADYT